MTIQYRAIISDELPGVDSVVVRTWMQKASDEVPDERAFILPKSYKLTRDNVLDLLFAAVDQTRQKVAQEKPAPKKRSVKKETKDGE